MQDVPELFGIPRSGSTAIYNICRIIYGDELLKRPTSPHEYFGGDSSVIATYRDFRDCLVSQWRAHILTLEGRSFDDESEAIEMRLDHALFHANDFKRAINSLDHFKADKDRGRNVLFLRYEDFFNSEVGDLNFEYIFEQMETFRGKEIPHLTKKYITEECNFKKVKEHSQQFDDFDQYDPQTLIHGKHLYTGKAGTWKTLIADEYHEVVTASLRDELTRWCYEL